MLSDYGASARASLHEVSAVLDLLGKFGISGSQVAGLVDEGRIEDVRHYCETDVLTTYLVYLRLMVHRGTIGIDGYNAAISFIVAMIEQEAGERPYLNDFMEAWGQASGNAFILWARSLVSAAVLVFLAFMGDALAGFRRRRRADFLDGGPGKGF